MELNLTMDPANSIDDFKNSRTFVKFSSKQASGATETILCAYLNTVDENSFVFDWVKRIGFHEYDNPVIHLFLTSYKPKMEGVRFPSYLDFVDPKTSTLDKNFGKGIAEFDFSSPNTTHDRILNLDRKKFHVQSGYLIMWSDYFTALFNGNFKEANEMEIKIEDVLPEDFETFLKFIYSCQLELTANNYFILISMGYRFMAPRVLTKCQEFISHNFDALDKLELIELAFKFNIQDIKDAVATYLESTAVSKNNTENLLDRNSFVINHRDRIAELSSEVLIFISQSILKAVKLG